MLLDSTEINALESRLISLFDRTFKKGIANRSGSQLKNSVKSQFKSKTFQIQLDKIIDDIYLYTVDFTDKLIDKTLKADFATRSKFNVLSAADTKTQDEPLVLTEEAVLQSTDLAEEVTDSIIRVLKDEAIYQEHPTKLARRVLDLWGGNRYRAERWARTFSANVATNTAIVRYQQHGIEQCQFYATIDKRTSPQCRMMHGVIMKVDSPEAHRYVCPLHHNCRSSVIPITQFSEYDKSLLYENRDFSKPVGQKFQPLEEGLKPEVVKSTFKNIDKFNEKYRIDKFVFDADVENRLMKLGAKIETKKENLN